MLSDFYNIKILDDDYNFSENGRELNYYAP